MNGFINKTVAGCILSAGLVSLLVGCEHYRDLVDPCYPERYDAMAIHSTREMFIAQEEKGHMLDQTVWNWMFEPDPKTGGPSDRLNGAGMAVLHRIARTLPCPDFQLFLQNSQDLPYVEGVPPEKIVRARNDLNDRRIAAIQRFLATEAAVHGGGMYQVAVHDFAPPGLPTMYPTLAEENILKNVKGGKAQDFSVPVAK